MDVTIASRIDDIGKMFLLRYKVFVLEQKFSESIEIDEHDNEATFLVAKEGSDVIGTLRLFKEGGDVVLGRMAVDAAWRGKGIGRALILAAVPMSRDLGGAHLVAHAQVQALGFYSKAGFSPHGEEFDEDGAPHRLVRIKLA
ncbi:MAG: GNAT family N-acetyltransferase [Candidatus Lokiarchaeota archaeon]|nr:GNAT family N-acetyltransferase [Candidatus Lokiarchaeota archaeon]